MRPEIWFRGRRIDTGEWVYGLPEEHSPCVPSWSTVELVVSLYLREACDISLREIHPETLGQRTGFVARDTQGRQVDIYEGDNLRDTARGDGGTVSWANGSFMIESIPLSDWISASETKIVITGSIHDEKTEEAQ